MDEVVRKGFKGLARCTGFFDFELCPHCGHNPVYPVKSLNPVLILAS